MLLNRMLCLCAAALLASCSLSADSNWYLMSSGYSINPVDGDDNAYSIEVHLNQLKQLGGEINSAEFRLFVAKRLNWHGLCPGGWQLLRCVEDGSCVQHTRRSITVPVRCVA
jgi:hypothetical protein